MVLVEHASSCSPKGRSEKHPQAPGRLVRVAADYGQPRDGLRPLEATAPATTRSSWRFGTTPAAPKRATESRGHQVVGLCGRLPRNEMSPASPCVGGSMRSRTSATHRPPLHSGADRNGRQAPPLLIPPHRAGRARVIDLRASTRRGTHRLVIRFPFFSAPAAIRRPNFAEGHHEEERLLGFGADTESTAQPPVDAERCTRPTSEPTHDSVRGRRVRRLPRRNHSTRILARSVDVTTVRRERKEVSSSRRAGLDPARRTNKSLVTTKRRRKP